MAAFLRPRRGTASGSSVVLKEGEIFLDNADSGNATSRASWGRIYVGNGTSTINALKPFIALPQDMVLSSGISSTGSDSDIDNGKSLSTIISAIKKLLSDHTTLITSLDKDKVNIDGTSTMTGNLMIGQGNGTIPIGVVLTSTDGQHIVQMLSESGGLLANRYYFPAEISGTSANLTVATRQWVKEEVNEYAVLLNVTTTTANTWQDCTCSDLSNYKLLVIFAGQYGNFPATTVIPYVNFKALTNTGTRVMTKGVNDVISQVYYKSDTKVCVSMNSVSNGACTKILGLFPA